MKKCELCDSLAKMYCESDQASLCWDCDSKVHSANFLVAKHSRTLLCRLCQSMTPWTAAGPKLTPTVSVCDICVNDSSRREERDNEEEEDDTEDGEDDENIVDEDDDEENQVVPWSSTAQPPVSSSSNSDQECSSRTCDGDEGAHHQSRIAFSLKRVRETAEPASQDHLSCFNDQNRSQKRVS